MEKSFQSTLSVWRATSERFRDYPVSRHFNPRSPCGERPITSIFKPDMLTFQSTLSVWRATSSCHLRRSARQYFNPRSPCGERPYAGIPEILPKHFNPRSPCGERPIVQPRADGDPIISIHALRVESDPAMMPETALNTNFNPRSPCGERRFYLPP